MTFPRKLMNAIFGQLTWSAPPWLEATNRFRTRSPLLFWTIPVLLLVAAGAWFYYASLPQPWRLNAEIYPPEPAGDYEGAKPNNLMMVFSHQRSNANNGLEQPGVTVSPARLDLIGKEIDQGVRLSPAKPGTWRWTSDDTLEFQPETDWPPGTEYTVSLDTSLFAPEARLAAREFTFVTPPFEANIDSIEFYQDPRDSNVRRVVATLSFSHPVAPDSLEHAIMLAMRPSDQGMDAKAIPHGFSLNFSPTRHEAYLQSEPVKLPEHSNTMSLTIAPGVKSILGGQGLQKELNDRVVIPDISSYLQLEDSVVQIVRNEKDEPEQVLSLLFTDEIKEEELLSKLEVYLLPAKWQNRNFHWSSVAQVDNNVLRASEKVDLQSIPNERDNSTRYSFKLDVSSNRGLYVKIGGGLRSVNNFIRKMDTDVLLYTPEYPKEVKLAGEGSVLTFSGSHQLRVLTRGVPGLKYSVGRVLDGQLNHLITQSYGDIKNPSFANWNFNEGNLATFSATIVDLAMQHPRQANYSSLDLSPWLNAAEQNTGLFFVNIEGWDPQRNVPVYGVQDKRLIMVTDLGILLKSNTDGSHEVFVQSIRDGQPVSGANVTLLAKNGLPLLSHRTDAQGHARFPLLNNSGSENEPVVYTVTMGGDTSFIPYNRATRQLQLSRFDIGGEYSWATQDRQLKAYAFSSRGIYRPGDTVDLGFIVKQANLGNIEGVPLEWRIHGPRGNQLEARKVMLPKFGFLDAQFKTEITSDTGVYNASLFLIEDSRRYRQLGSTEFSVEEFQPDTMKITSRFVDVGLTGWTNKTKLQAQVTLQNLFGLPAQDRKLEANMHVRPARFAFRQYSSWNFRDPYEGSEASQLSIEESLPALRTDNNGQAVYDIDLDRFKSGTYRLDFSVEGFDQAGGRGVSSQNALLISPLESLVGVKADGDLNYININRDRALEFIAIDSELKQITRESLTLRVLEIQQVSTLIKQPNGTYQYQSVEREKELSARDFAIPAGGTTYKLDTSTPGDFAIEVTDPQGLKVARARYSVVGHGNMAGRLDKNAELQLKLNKTDYKPGEEIELNIRGPYLGAGLITIETDKVETWKWFRADSQSIIERIRIPEHLEGGAYLHVALVRDVDSKEIFASPLSYAVEHFSLDKSRRVIDIDLTVPEITQPGSTMAIAYSASETSRIAVFAVDEGILQVANYRMPDPLDFYLTKKALGVNTWQIMDLILPEFEILRALSAPGGDTMEEVIVAGNRMLNPFQRKVDKPAVFWSGIIDADKQKRSVNFTVPDTFSGSLRVMAVAVSDDALGKARESALVRGPFVISPQVLTSTVPGDEFTVVAGVSNIIEGSGKNAEVTLQINSSPHLQILGEQQITLNIDEGSEASASFRIKTLNKLGAAELTFTARHKDRSQSRSASLSVRPATTYQSTFTSAYEKDGKATHTVQRDLYGELAQNRVSASASPLVLVDGLSSYLEHFPHGCTEQVVSQVFPLVGLMSHPAYGPHVKNVQQHFAQLIGKLAERQTNDGGFNFWPGDTQTVEYPTVYAAHFLVEALNQGFNVPASMQRRVQDWLTDFAQRRTENPYQARVRANAIYLLTRMGTVTTNMLVDLRSSLESQQEKEWKTDLAAVYMAASYALLKNNDSAEKLVDEYELAYRDRKSYTDFDSILTQDSQYIYLLAKHFPQRAKKLNGDDILGLTEKVFRGEYNTIAAAYTILALGAYSELVTQNYSPENIRFSAKLADATDKVLQAQFSPFASAQYPVDTREIAVESDKPLFYLDTQTGYDKNLPTESVRQNLEITRDYLDPDGNAVSTFAQGRELTVRLRVRTLDGKQRSNIAVVDLLPGGFEVDRESVDRSASHGWNPDYIDIREDRVIYYGTFDANVKEISYKVKLTTAGKFVVPPAHAESMYDRAVIATSVPGEFNVMLSQ